MDIDEVRGAYRREQRESENDGEVLESLPLVTRRSILNGEVNFVTAHDLDDRNVESAIQAEIDHFRAIEREFEWKAYSFDSPSNLVDRLRNAGFEVGIASR